ncbi:MAG: hypothetical protein M3Q89_04325 [Verrucomicrobiota bacterium]|nr:hypothetical protein [Verrucomicrobiota bacterium]
MESPAGHQWYLRKNEDGSVFGPLSFDQLARWASSAQVAPHDSISTDALTWIKAPMLPELDMDWIAEVTSERLYGPTTLGAIREFIRLGEIDDATFVINTCDATRRQTRDIAHLLESLPVEEQETTEAPDGGVGPAATGMSIAVEERIRELEQALREERRALVESEERYRELEMRYREAVSPDLAL